MHPEITVNYLAITASVVMSMVLGFLWYGPLFGKKWAAMMGMKMEDCKPASTEMLKCLGLTLLGNCLTSYVLYYSIHIWRPSLWNYGVDLSPCTYGFYGAFYTWLGFYIPMLLCQLTWERRPPLLFVLNAAYHFINLQIVGMILSCWK